MRFICSLPKNRSILITSIFIAVTTTHLAILNLVWKHELACSNPQVNVRLLESFAVQTENTYSENKQTEETLSQNQITTQAPEQSTFEGQPEKVLEIKKIQPLDQSPIKKIPLSTTGGSLPPQATSNTPPITHASYLNNPAPPYPRTSRRLGEQGKVVLAVEISTQGDAAQAIVITSSGYPRLDQAALETVLKWRFVPGKKAGVPQKMWVNIPINFVIE